jgi:hypothetical protein
VLESRPTILQVLECRGLFGGLTAFEDLESWQPWLTFLGALYGLPLDKAQQRRFCEHTGRKRYDPPEGGFKEAVCIVGVQSGKSRIAATIAAFEGLTCPRQEDGTNVYALVLAQDLRSAGRAIFSYTTAPFESMPVLAHKVVNKTAASIELDSGIVIASYPCRPASIRGLRARVIILDEFAFYVGEPGATDQEMLRAARGRLATTGGRLIVISSPYGQAGALYDMREKHWGKDDSPVLVWQASAPEMNPTLPKDYLERMKAEDPEAYESEVLGNFRSGTSNPFDRESIAAVTVDGPVELAPAQGIPYAAFADPSGGRSDAFAIAIGHQLPPDGRAVVDCIRKWEPPFNPTGVVAEAAGLLRRYGVVDVWGDKYAGEWPREAFGEHGINYEQCSAPKSDLYLSFLAAVNGQRVELPAEPELQAQLVSLERKRGSSGRDKIDHRTGGHDDVANAVAGLCTMLLSEGGSAAPSFMWI